MLKTIEFNSSLVSLIALVLGVGIWLPQLAGTESYPVDYHRLLVINGFTIFSLMSLLRLKFTTWSLALFGLATLTSLVSSDLSLCLQTSLMIFWLFTKRTGESTLQVLALFFLFASGLGPLIQQVHYSTYHLIESSLFLFVLTFIIDKRSTSIFLKICLLLFALSCLVEQVYAELFKFILWVVILLRLKLPIGVTALEKCRSLGLWLFPIGILAKAFAWDYGVHLSHITFVGSFILFVVLQQFDKLKGWIAWTITTTIIFAMLTRVSAIFMAESYYRHLAYGAIVLIIAIAGAMKAKKA